MKVAIVIPAYNEEKVIASVIQDVKQFFDTVIVIDDGSSDKTGEMAQQAGAIVLSLAVNCGQGAALQTGIDFAYKHGADIIVTFDADGQFLGKEIQEVIAPIQSGSVDFVKGSRFLGKKANMSLFRQYCLKAAILMTNVTTGGKFTDVHNGFMAYSRYAAQTIRINRQPRMAHQSEIMSELVSNNISYTEVPVTVLYTEYSQSKGQKFSDYVRILRELFLGHFH